MDSSMNMAKSFLFRLSDIHERYRTKFHRYKVIKFSYTFEWQSKVFKLNLQYGLQKSNRRNLLIHMFLMLEICMV